MGKYLLALGLFFSACLLLSGQKYQWPQDEEVSKKLEWWQDQKFGFMMHWGTYSQLGIVESWALCSEPWISRRGADYYQFKMDYEALPQSFNPVKFDPQKWAKAAKDAGMRYVVFTTKHHDGFCMFDSKYTDYKITGPNVPFRNHVKANVAKEIFSAFRQEGMGIGAYFSKPDWNHPDYWAKEWATPNRCNNYDIRKYPERWQRFKDFTYNQIKELTTEYGSIDILWLDGGWVRPDSTINEEVLAWGYDIPEWEQDIDMPRIAKMARTNQPGLIIVDRSVHGPYEDYRTPEQRVPDRTLPYPWETCMTMSQSWSYNRNPRYKSSRQLIHLLIDIVAKGGNFLLNVGPGPDGTIDEEAFVRMKDMGDWLDLNGDAIYSTRPIKPYKEGKICYTRKKDTRQVNAIYLPDANEDEIPHKIFLYSIQPEKGSQVTLLETGASVKWEAVANGALIEIGGNLRKEVKNTHAWVFQFSVNSIPE